MTGAPGAEGAWDVVVVGAGPAGLLAAGRAAQLGARVLLLEKMEKPARKLRISGKGRGNVGNARPLAEQLREVRTDPAFLAPAFRAFFTGDLEALLAGQGVPLQAERGGRIFPASGRAWDVAEALVAWARGQGVEILRHARVASLEVREGRLQALALAPAGPGRPRRIPARCAVIATGGCSYPATGATGDGHRFARATGHRVEPLRPALVAVRTRPALPEARGVTLRNVRVTLRVDGQDGPAEFGEAEFTDRGLGGAAVLRLSRDLVDALAAGREAQVVLDLKPALEAAKLKARLQRELEARRGGPCRELLRQLLPGPLVGAVCTLLGLSPGAPAAILDGPTGDRLVALLKGLEFQVTGHGGWAEAIITAGGVDLRDVDPATLASRRVPNLYFAGEVLDLDANTGGYNLQIAFSTGWLAGESAARRALDRP